MKQKYIYTIAGFADAGDKAVNGATLHPELVSINEADAIAANVAAMLEKRDNYENAKALLGNSRDQLASLKKTSRETLVLGRDLLKKDLGSRYHQGWDSTGLIGKLSISSQLEKVKSLLSTFKAHFTANPTRENAPLGITAVNYNTLRNDLIAAHNTVINQDTAMRMAKVERDAAVRAMDKRLSDLFGELKMKLGTLDPRWLAFGFNLPGLKQRPETPGKVVANAISSSEVSVKWEASARAEYYRIWLKKADQPEPEVVGTREDLDFVIPNLPAQTEVEVGVSAVNNGGESATSEFIKVTTQPTQATS